MGESYQIKRAALEEDQGTIIKLHLLSFDGGFEAIPHLGGAWWLVWFGDTAVGFGGIHPSSYFKRTGYLCRSAVLPAHQGRGLQKRLIKARERWARANGYTCIITDTDSTNFASSNSLIRCGYKLWEPKQHIKWADHDVSLYWMKWL